MFMSKAGYRKQHNIAHPMYALLLQLKLQNVEFGAMDDQNTFKMWTKHFKQKITAFVALIYPSPFSKLYCNSPVIMATGENEVIDTLDLSWNHFRGQAGVAIIEGIKVIIMIKIFVNPKNSLQIHIYYHRPSPQQITTLHKAIKQPHLAILIPWY